MADSAVAPPTPARTVWDFLTSEAVSKCLVLLVGTAIGVAGTHATQRLVAPHFVLQAADPPAQPTPVSCERAAHSIDTKLNDILSRLPAPKGRAGK